MESGKLKNLIILTLLLTNVFLLYVFYSNNKISQDNTTEKIEYNIDENLSNRNNSGVIVFSGSMDMDKEFYTRLWDCIPSELATNSEHEYTIYGVEISGNMGEVCHFQERMNDNILDCLLPMDVAKRYSEAGKQEFEELEELKRNNKSGMVQSSNYINEINNNSDYCAHASTFNKGERK